MKKIRIISIITLLVITMVGCSSKEGTIEENEISSTFTKAVEEGKLAIAENDYTKAVNMFTLALEENNDEDISNLNQQCKLVQDIINRKENIENEKEIDDLVSLCDEVISIATKSNLVKDKANELKIELEDMKNQYLVENKKEETITDKETESKKQEYIQKIDIIEHETSKVSYDGSTVEMKEASSKVLKMWDDLLNEIYGVLKTQLSTEDMESVKIEQREWIATRDAFAKENSSQFEGGTMEGLEYSETLVKFTKERCYELVEKYMK